MLGANRVHCLHVYLLILLLFSRSRFIIFLCDLQLGCLIFIMYIVHVYIYHLQL